VTYEWQAAFGSCNLGSPSAALYYFVEIAQNDVYTCSNLGYASGGAQNRMSVQRGSDNLWHAYQNGAGVGVSTSWTRCGGDACAIEAFAENFTQRPGYYYAKFAGSNQTPWQYYNGSKLEHDHQHAASSVPWHGMEWADRAIPHRHLELLLPPVFIGRRPPRKGA
jgi:hypothetical protein